MTPMQEQLVALGGVFQAAVLVDKIAKTGQVSEAALGCMLGSLLVMDPKDTLEVYGGDDLNLREGYRSLVSALERDPTSLQREPLRYALSMLGLERQLAKRDDLLEVIGKRLPQIKSQVEHFGLVHDNVIAASGALYQDTLSTLRQRIQVHGDMRNLQQPNNASKIRALLLAGIRSARLWRQLGGHRWQLVISRRKLLKELYPMLRG
ncbi:high frequency lysogenization protein HflD [Pseudomonas sp. RTC3]|jgi:high frequency lysogenization protein|uniref:high frequency lysogenization protein HflD n=1 Tax=unclassified Pseudomonas TaxID=196821 RepID=UPI002AB4F7B3|nr:MULTISPECIES: high frequency lysogenization protein HflD [unclassified Pseudomonas]MEB0064710.1 high frequency lysogenization protein HflD [Pseudomonas sp. RTC3]MDY7565518.1 high frequency lysogenization protein HflD [Pseudomonas sp. 5C2]MEB0008844.1 high frequency lysogenization protein HflD [Pseudomonas sp. RTB2]MEB0019217.1 high frequency lysogenization protein HflD [Pseudomonas sp. RTB3]MEB0027768.1 high frequency lysogenization protein HflD [Pseudomonas sp. MH9.2]